MSGSADIERAEAIGARWRLVRLARAPKALAMAVLAALLGLAIALLPLKLGAALSLGMLSALAIAIRPRWGLYLLPLAVPFGSLWEAPLGPMRVGLAEVLVLLTLGSWLLRMAALGRIELARVKLALPFLFFGAAALLSLPGAVSLPESAKELLKWLELAGVYAMVASICERGQVKLLVALAVLAGALQAGIGIAQSALGLGPEGFRLTLAGRDLVRAYGTFGQPNPFGGYMGLSFALAYGLLGGAGGVAMRLLALAGAGLSGLGLALSLSRGAWLGVGFAFPLMNLLWGGRRTAAFLALVVAVAAGLAAFRGSLGLVPPLVLERLAGLLAYARVFDVRGIVPNPENWAQIERLAHWQAAWEMFVKHPWLGVGIGNYVAAYPAYALPGWEDPLGHAHNYYLNILAEAGVMGLVAYLILVVSFFWLVWDSWRRSLGLSRAVLVGIWGVLVVFSLHNLFDNLYVHGMNIHLGMLLGIAEVIGRGKHAAE